MTSRIRNVRENDIYPLDFLDVWEKAKVAEGTRKRTKVASRYSARYALVITMPGGGLISMKPRGICGRVCVCVCLGLCVCVSVCFCVYVLYISFTSNSKYMHLRSFMSTTSSPARRRSGWWERERKFGRARLANQN